MNRTPLRPLARILKARAVGDNPDRIERENIRARAETTRDRDRARAEKRLLVLALLFFAGFTLIGIRMGQLAATEPSEPQTASAGDPAILTQRADIVDRQGRILATNLVTNSLYAQPQQMVDPVAAAQGLAAIFPDLDAAALLKDFTGGRKFLWIKRKISPEQMQMVHEIGDPGLMFGPREMRLYPNGAIASHILGGASFGREGVASAEVIGTAGVEKTFDGWLRDPANGGAPLALSISLPVQAVVEEVLSGGMKMMNAKGASAILMDVRSGEIIAMASLPDFDPNDRPPPLAKGDASDSPLFNRAVQGVYELGSTFKIFAVAEALELGLVTTDTIIDTRSPMRIAGGKITDFTNNGPQNSVTEVIVKSSNVGTARIASMIGPQRQQSFLQSLGLFQPTAIEMVEASTGKPILPKKWSDVTTMTVGYGYGLSASPLHLAVAYASLVNGGRIVTPTLLKSEKRSEGARVVSPETSAIVRSLLRQVVVRGTASFGDVVGYEVGGKTGTANKVGPDGKYDKDRVRTTFSAIFPASAPQYALVVSLDEPVETSGSEPRRTAGWTSVPVAAEIIRRAAPMMGLRPQTEAAGDDTLTLVRN